jgi:hypothetical protein
MTASFLAPLRLRVNRVRDALRRMENRDDQRLERTLKSLRDQSFSASRPAWASVGWRGYERQELLGGWYADRGPRFFSLWLDSAETEAR